MKVYVVVQHGWDYDAVVKVYASKEAAKASCLALSADDLMCYDVEEHEVVQ